ncbi:MAG TPA: hypothetical protein IGS53_09205 [Leptolyngbyaceae cyanobacterium M33_DOE_097]|nr:hypothetical protein [Leptolyngbyaceae cyanobacterium M33_DOE_097]
MGSVLVESARASEQTVNSFVMASVYWASGLVGAIAMTLCSHHSPNNSIEA